MSPTLTPPGDIPEFVQGDGSVTLESDVYNGIRFSQRLNGSLDHSPSLICLKVFSYTASYFFLSSLE